MIGAAAEQRYPQEIHAMPQGHPVLQLGPGSLDLLPQATRLREPMEIMIAATRMRNENLILFISLSFLNPVISGVECRVNLF